MEHVSIIHIPFNISNSDGKRSFPSWTHSSVIFANSTIGSSRSMALRFVAAFVLPPCQTRWESATDAVTCSQKNFVNHHTTSWPSTWIVGWYAGTTTQGHLCTAQTLPTPILPSQPCANHAENPCFWRPCTNRDLSTYLSNLLKARGKCWKNMDWLSISLIHNNATRTDWFLLFTYSLYSSLLATN